MTPADLAAIRERLEKATPGPWRECGADRNGCICGMVWATCVDALIATMSTSPIDVAAVTPEKRAANAEFIAHAPSDVRALLAEVERLTKLETELASEMFDLLDAFDCSSGSGGLAGAIKDVLLWYGLEWDHEKSIYVLRPRHKPTDFASRNDRHTIR